MHQNDTLLSRESPAPSTAHRKDMIQYGSISSSHDTSSPTQLFYSISLNKHKELCEQYKNGMLVHQNYENTIDTILQSFSSESFSLFCTDKVQAPPSKKSKGSFIRQFAGAGSPPIDSTFSKFTNIEGLSIYYKFDDANKFCEYPPHFYWSFSSWGAWDATNSQVH